MNSANNRCSPNIEKKIIKPAEICITLRLPTRVVPKRPTFSLLVWIWNYLLEYNVPKRAFKSNRTGISISTYTETVDPVTVPKSPSKRIPIPYDVKTACELIIFLCIIIL